MHLAAVTHRRRISAPLQCTPQCWLNVPLIPAKAGTQGYTHRNKSLWIPAFAGMSGWWISSKQPPLERIALARIHAPLIPTKIGMSGAAG